MEYQMTTDILNHFTNDPKVKDEILAYAKNKFSSVKGQAFNHSKSSLKDEEFVIDWIDYLQESKTKGVFQTLQSHLVQLNFPIAQNLSQSDCYKSATLRGKKINEIPEATGLILAAPNKLELKIHHSIAGKIPVLVVEQDDDFKTLIRALCHKNEPVDLPKSMGAAMINGINNWSKIRVLKEQFTLNNPSSDWNNHFKQHVIPNKSLYQDKLIILSKKAYSGVQAETLSQDPKEWKNVSLKIRLEHECAHYYTLRQFGVMANNMHDEIIADYAGICGAQGSYNPEWFLRFIGLENYPKYRRGARLENYLGSPALSQSAFEVLKNIIYKAVINIYKFDRKIENRKDPDVKIATINSLSLTGILEMAQENGSETLHAQLQKQLTSENSIV